jgi:hypothetical protein
VLVCGGMRHDFESRSGARAWVLNFSVPGGFQPNMPAISQRFREHPPASTNT